MHVREIPWLEPFEAAERLRPLGGLGFLDSAMRHDKLGRYSYVAADPFGKLVIQHGVASFNGTVVDRPPLDAISHYLKLYRLDDEEGAPPFQGGAIGYFSYEFGRLLERLPQPAVPAQGSMPDATWYFYDVVLAFDQEGRKAWLLSSGLPETDTGARTRKAAERSRFFSDCIDREREQEPVPPLSANRIPRAAWQSNFERDSYMKAVAKVVEYILDGDIFQANIAQRFSADLPVSFEPWRFYKEACDAEM